MSSRAAMSLAPGHAEGGDLGVLPRSSRATSLEVRGVLRVRERVAAFDVVDAQIVEPLGDEQLVLRARS